MRAPTGSFDDLVLGTAIAPGVPAADQVRQRREVDEILARLERQPGVILADEVGMGKTFVALAVAIRVAMTNPVGPVVVMAPSTLVQKWQKDLEKFCELYMPRCRPAAVGTSTREMLTASNALRHATARESIELLRLLDDPLPTRAHVIFVSHGAMSRQRMDKWVNLHLVAEALRQFARGRNQTLIQVRGVIHRHLAELLWMTGSERRHDLGDDLWERLLRSDPSSWKEIYNSGIRHDERKLSDDPVPKSVRRAIGRIDLHELTETLKRMPIRARGGQERVSERIAAVRQELRNVDQRLWSEVLAVLRWRSPLLIMDEAHHLKNAETKLARQLQSAESTEDLRTGDGAMANSFDRMLFLTATPFQLGHQELVHVLHRFGDVRWNDDAFGERARFMDSLAVLHHALDESQRASIKFQRCWSLLRREDLPESPGKIDDWWSRIKDLDTDSLTYQQRAVRDAYEDARSTRHRANELLRPLVIRHNKGERWPDSNGKRRLRREGAAITNCDHRPEAGIEVPGHQLLPFFLAARAAVDPHKDLLGDALCSSYEAFRKTREDREHPEDRDAEGPGRGAERERHSAEMDSMLLHRDYLTEFDASLARISGAEHPKMAATVGRVADLWEQGEKVVVFAFYRHTCIALRNHISNELRNRMIATARARLGTRCDSHDPASIEATIANFQDRYFDNTKSPRKQAIDAALDALVDRHAALLARMPNPPAVRELLISIMRRFLRVNTTVARCFPFELDGCADPKTIANQLLDHADASGQSWRQKFDSFTRFVLTDCPATERDEYLSQLQRIRTGAHKAGSGEASPDDGPDNDVPTDGTTLANVSMCSGATSMEVRIRHMRTFNTPFFPDILVCSEVMAEGVDLQRYCRHMIHHDLAWNPSTIEQRTGRIDRIGCKAENAHPIVAYLPYIDGGADQRQYRVMRDREQWFQVVMGQDAVANLITAETVESAHPLPRSLTDSLAFDLSLAPAGNPAR